MVNAGRYFDERAINADMGIRSADDLWRWAVAGATTPLPGHRGAAAPSGPRVVYRGQANANYGLSSSLYRECRKYATAQVVEADLAKAESAIITTMRDEGLGRRMTDGELLMVLQHHGIPTRLVDVSAEPLEALFFAVDHNDAASGRLFIIELHHQQRVQMDQFARRRPLPWADAARGTQQAQGDWTDTVALIDELPLDPRMRAQQGKFLVGGLNRRATGRAMKLDGVNIARDEYPDVTSLGINFLQQRRPDTSRRWPARGWTIKIESDWKPALRDHLEALEDSIRADTMYPPVGEVRRLALSVLRGALLPGDRTS